MPLAEPVGGTSAGARGAGDLADLVLAGDARAAARLITLVENGDEAAREALDRFPAGQAKTIGITGPPGCGKSTLVDRVITEYRRRGLRVGVLAVDPSSPFSGGAVLGDRIRMGDHIADPGVFVRSMATRGHLGGIARSSPSAIRVLDALGCERVLVETVGVGQSEVAVAAAVDCTVLVLVPGLGDSVQAMKAGLMEIGQIFVVNKADREGAPEARRELETMLRMRGNPDPYPPVVLLTSATRAEGVTELVDAMEGLL